MADRSEHRRPLAWPPSPPLTAPRATRLLPRSGSASPTFAPAALPTPTSHGRRLGRIGHLAQTLLPLLTRNRQHQYEIGWQPLRCPHVRQLGGLGCQQLVTRPAVAKQIAAARLNPGDRHLEPLGESCLSSDACPRISKSTRKSTCPVEWGNPLKCRLAAGRGGC